MNKQDLARYLEANLPPVFLRENVEKLTGGVVNYHTLCSQDSRGEGPPGKFRYSGRKIAYQREGFIAWFIEKSEPLRDF